jgi:uncharacterized protein YecT (DUF1311 family)
MEKILTQFAVLTLTLLSTSAMAQQMSSSELSCRAKAKEIAAQTYNTCITESRTAQVDQLRKEYQQQVAELKARYDKELKKMGSKEVAPKDSSSKEITSTDITASARNAIKANAKKPKRSASTGSRPKPTKGIAKTLPTRKEVKTQASQVLPQAQYDGSQASEDVYQDGSESAPALLSSDEQAAQNEMELTLVPSSDSGSEQY